MRPSSLGTPHHAVNVHGHDLLSSLGGPINERAIFPRNTRVGDKDIETAVELADNLVDGALNSLS